MRTFVLYARKARTDAKFELSELAEAGRMDLVGRCISSALWLSHKAREDARIFVVLNGPPNPPVTICFSGSAFSTVFVDETMNAKWIKEILSLDFGRDWLDYKGIEGREEELPGSADRAERKNYVLHEKGEFIENVKLDKKPDNNAWATRSDCRTRRRSSR